MEEVNGRDDQTQNEESSYSDSYSYSWEWFLKYLNRQGDWLEKTRGNLMVAATVIASMSFQVMVNPPGGVWQADNCPTSDQSGQSGSGSVCKAKAGTSVLEHVSSKRGLYLGMIISSTVSFSASMSLILLVISGLRLRNRMIMALLITFMVTAVLCMSAAFFFAVALVQSEDEIIVYILMIYLVFWLVFPVMILVSQLVRFLGWLFCFICCCCCRRRRPRRPRRSSPRRLPSVTP